MFQRQARRLVAPRGTPIVSNGDLHLKVIRQHCDRGSVVLTANQPHKLWPRISNNDSTSTGTVLDPLLHHDEKVINGKSFRMENQIATS